MTSFAKSPRFPSLIAGCALLLVACLPPAHSAPPQGAASKPLFNGKNLDGWKQAGPGRFVVTNGLLKTEGGMGLLWYTRSKIGHSKLRVVFKLTSKEADSGVFIRIPRK